MCNQPYIWIHRISRVSYAFNDNPNIEPIVEAVRIRIWNGDPTDPASEVIFGTLTINRLLNAEFTGFYRTNERTISSCIRLIMRITAEIDTKLPAGDYWLEWQFEVPAIAKIYRTPPITILGQSDTGDAVQSVDGGVSYQPITDKGNGATQGLPFVIYCSGDTPLVSTVPTMGQWGLICLALLFLIVGTVRLAESRYNKEIDPMLI